MGTNKHYHHGECHRYPTAEETDAILRAPWKIGHLQREFRYEGDHSRGEKIAWKVYHNDPDYISVRLLDKYGIPIVEFTESYDLVEEAEPNDDWKLDTND